MDPGDTSTSRTFVHGILVALAALLLAAGAVWFLQVREGRPVPAQLEEDDSAAGRAATDPRVRVSAPRPNDVVSSPLTVRGEARGPWYFEADFPVRLLDGDGSALAIEPAQALGEWMTEDFVPFEVTLAFQEPGTPTGLLTLDRSNPSGLSQHAARVVLPIRFA